MMGQAIIRKPEERTIFWRGTIDVSREKFDLEAIRNSIRESIEECPGLNGNSRAFAGTVEKMLTQILWAIGETSGKLDVVGVKSNTPQSVCVHINAVNIYLVSGREEG